MKMAKSVRKPVDYESFVMALQVFQSVYNGKMPYEMPECGVDFGEDGLYKLTDIPINRAMSAMYAELQSIGRGDQSLGIGWRIMRLPDLDGDDRFNKFFFDKDGQRHIMPELVFAVCDTQLKSNGRLNRKRVLDVAEACMVASQ